MFDQSFNSRTLSKCLLPIDFSKWKTLQSEEHRRDLILLSQKRADDGFLGLDLTCSIVKGKSVYSIDSLADILVMRKIQKNIHRFNKVKSSSRVQLIDGLRILLSENIKYRIYRLDIKSFYESFSKEFMNIKIDQLNKISHTTSVLLKQLVFLHHYSGGKGLPRGLPISSLLSELFMSDFDKKTKNNSNIFFYGRYVDDIIILTDGSEDKKEFTRKLASYLPSGMSFNYGKKYLVSNVVNKFNKPEVGEPNILFEFEYLGYDFKINNEIFDCKIRGTTRKVSLDISKSKVNKIKTRIVRSIMSFNNDNNFDLLCDRLRFLTTNFSIVDKNKELKRLSGLHYNYHLVDPNHSCSLLELNSFLKKSILSSEGKIFSVFNFKTTQKQKHRLLQFCFIRGHMKCTFFHYSFPNMAKIQGCWKYV